MQWVTATDLEQWAGTLASRHALSRLVADLVRASATSITAYRFPTGDSSELPGYDGILEAEAIPPWVPGGKSVWEFGTGDDPRAKATADYNKRTENPGAGIVPGETAFIFVTPRRWRGQDGREKQRWIDERQGGPWAAVGVLDAVDLEAWLDANPGVAARFASGMLRLLPQEGVRSAADFWDEYAAGTRPRLTEHVLIAGRPKEAETVRGALGRIPSRIVVRADSRDEALAFSLAAGRAGEEESKRFLDCRTLVVDSDEAARRLQNRSRLIIGLRAPVGESAGLLLERGNSVILPLGNDAPNQTESIRLPRASTSEFSEALRTLGLEDEEANRLARESGRSVTILFRRIPAGARRDPDWLRDVAHRDPLISAMVAGAWDSASPADRAAVETLSAIPCDDFEARLRPLLHVADPPLQQIGSVWTVVAPVDLFEGLARYIGPRNLQALRQACERVLGEVDPAVDLPPDERVYAALHRRVLAHSSWLRDGLTQTLLLIAVRGEFAGLACDGGPQLFANSVIANLPALRDNHRLVASLQNQLPLLMEAAPDPLLSALEHLLEGDGRRIVDVFTESGWLGPSSYHTGLLWALESAAWDPRYFDRAVTSLVRLARIDPGGKLSNRPLNSLRAIFLPWFPSTNAPLSMRLGTLDSLLRREPDIGWQLLAALLPSFHDSSMSTYKPRWRDAGASEKEVLTRRLVLNTYQAIVERALGHAGDDADRWQKLITSMHAFDRADLEKVRGGLRQFASRVRAGQARFKVWSALRDEINRHRRFASADWSLPSAELDRFDDVVASLAPADIVDQYVWLFDEYHPDLPEPYERSEIDAADEPRRRAIAAIVGTDGLDGLLRLAERVKLGGLVGAAVVEVIPEMGPLQQLMGRALAGGERLETFAAAVSGEAARRLGVPWIEWVISEARRGRWTPRQVSTAMLFWPDVPATWQAVSAFGDEVDRLYWTNKPMLHIAEPEARAAAIRKYIAVDRAVMALARFSHHSDTVPSNVLLDLVDASLRELATGTIRPSGNFGFELEEILENLAARADVEPLEVAKREYAFLPLIDHRQRRLVLHNLLTSEPELYVQILSDVYRAASEPADREVTEEQTQRATMGYRLLQSMKTVPGSDEKGTLDGAVLRKWVLDVRDLAARADRAEIADHQIGRLLAYAPHDSDDHAWPHRAVRDLLEELRSDALESSMQSEQINKRGGYSKAPFEGGVQERGLATRAREWARASRDWPRTSTLLERIAEMWERYAAREDEDAEKDKARWG